MMNDSPMSLENELWDDDSTEGIGPITHNGCGGRVFWIYREEFRCIKCCAVVELDLMEIKHGAAANQE